MRCHASPASTPHILTVTSRMGRLSRHYSLSSAATLPHDGALRHEPVMRPVAPEPRATHSVAPPVTNFGLREISDRGRSRGRPPPPQAAPATPIQRDFLDVPDATATGTTSSLSSVPPMRSPGRSALPSTVAPMPAFAGRDVHLGAEPRRNPLPDRAIRASRTRDQMHARSAEVESWTFPLRPLPGCDHPGHSDGKPTAST